MIATEQGKEKRQHQRYNIASGAFALLLWNGSEILGAVKDISYGGLCVSHIDDSGELQNLTGLTINLISGKTCHENFHGKCVWNKKEKGGFATSMVKMKRCGIAFGVLDTEQKQHLADFIDRITKE